ncbi:MAG: hypothetical protein LBI06_03815 [Treponema sp.]|jgi:hypothetical protein|nr:hypothetical protein [Treponema sp.]
MTRVGIKAELDIGDINAKAGQLRGALHTIGEAMKQAETDKRWDDYGKLAYEKEKLQGGAAGFEKNIRTFANNPKFQGTGPNGQPVFKIDQEYATLIKDQTAAIKKLTAEYMQAINDGDLTKAQELSPQIEKQQNDFKKLVESLTSKPGGGAAGEAVKSIALNQVVSAIKSGMDVWVSSLDRTSVINSLGGGDVLGGSLAERQRRTAQTTGILNTAGATAQGVGLALAPFTGGISLLVGTGVNLLTNVASSLTEAGQKKYANRIAYSSLWDDQKDQAMSFAAVMGNPSEVRPAWKQAADAAAGFGYTAEEGMEAMKAAAQQGLDGATLREAVADIFRYERATGADRGTLTSLANMSARYGGGDALRAGWAGLEASGMKTGQYNEFLRGMQRVMEDGISKGFLKSSDQVAQNLSMLAQMTNYNPMWQGEQGANRLMKMNSGLEGTVELTSSSDMVAFRAAKRLLGDDISYVDINAFTQRHGIGGEYTDEHGVEREYNGTELFHSIMEVAKEVENGNREGVIEIMRAIYGLTYPEAIALHDSYRPGINGYIPESVLNRGLPDPSSKELSYAVESMEVKNLIIEAGMGIWDEEIRKAFQLVRDEYAATIGAGTVTPPQDAFFGANGALTPAATVFNNMNTFFSGQYDPEEIRNGQLPRRPSVNDPGFMEFLNNINMPMQPLGANQTQADQPVVAPIWTTRGLPDTASNPINWPTTNNMEQTNLLLRTQIEETREMRRAIENSEVIVNVP